MNTSSKQPDTKGAAASRSPNFYAQYGEDRALLEIFGQRTDGVAIEVGAFDGRKGSNTLTFEELGWRTILVEPNPLLVAKIKSLRRAEVFECAVGAVPGSVVLSIPAGAETLSSVSDDPMQVTRMERSGTGIQQIQVAQRTLDDILEEAQPGEIQFMTIDVEGYESDALRGFNLARWRPRIVIIEDNWSGTEDRIPLIMAAAGYIRFRNTGCNDWYCLSTDTTLISRFGLFWVEGKKWLKAIKKVTMIRTSRLRQSLNTTNR